MNRDNFLVKVLVFGLAGAMVLGNIALAAPVFDATYYAQMNPDVVAALGDSPEILELHYNISHSASFSNPPMSLTYSRAASTIFP